LQIRIFLTGKIPQSPFVWKEGLRLGVIALIIGTILDVIITVPLFVKSYVVYFTSWTLYFGYVELLLLTILAGAEFDGTFTKENVAELKK